MRTLTHKMRTLTYNMPNDIYTYVITCPNDLLGMYVRLLIENGAYKIFLNNEVIYNAK